MKEVFKKRLRTSRSVWLRLFLVIASLTASLQPAFAKTYDGVDAEVPFKFKVGDRSFRPGRYQLLVVGTNLLAMRDAHAHTVASFITRPIENGGSAPQGKLIFKRESKRNRLTQVWIANHTQGLEVVGEQVAMRPSGPPPEPVPAFVINSLFQREGAPGMRH